MSAELTSLSKFLALVLRHKPEAIGIKIEDEGWVDVEDLIARCKKAAKRIDLATLQKIVETDSKGRYSFKDDYSYIRANQGHSVSVEMKFEPTEPPASLYHGTADRFVDSIMKQGILRGERQYVHLSLNHETAVLVGQRHGRPVVLHVDAARMHAEGHSFYVSENRIWLVEHVPAKYLRRER